MPISARARDIQASPIRKLKPFADEARAKGLHVFQLNIGDPDVPTPRPVLDAFRAYDEPVIGYGPSQGFLELREAIARYYGFYGLSVAADDVMITTGGSEAIHFAFSIVAEHGEEILIPEPFYTNYNGYASFAGVRIVPIPLHVEDGFRLPPVAEIEARITPRTRAVLLCSPNNPTGTVYTREEIQGVVDLVVKHDLFLIGDEVYKEFVYDGLKHTSVLEFPEVRDRVLVVDSISKRYSCCGARIGALIVPNPEVYQAALRFGQARLCPPTVEQVAALAAYNMGMDYFAPVQAEYRKRRDILYEGLKDVPGIVIGSPQGAFYFIARLPVRDAEHFVQWMLTDFSLNGKTVMVAPGPGFYSTPGRGIDEVRIAYVLKEEDLREAGEILKAGLAAYAEAHPHS
ncbi:MAG: pyridoxal phosphate-dependent aminotransferase [Acidobacteriota bacterium]|nr:pyridoxal phosphate-dependent aminotransferase [Acidobacteriota bacterium]